jgi:Conjugative transposon protein TcpC
MVRRATVDRSPQSGVHADYGTVAADATGSPAAPWRGAGGRWLVWLLRGVAWLVVLLIGYNGVLAIVTREANPQSAATVPVSHGTGFPESVAAAYALQFGQVYLNASPATAAQRASQLAAFLPQGADPQLGWTGTGTLKLSFEQVARVSSSDAHHGTVILLAEVNGHLMELGVPIYADGNGLAVSGEPAWLPAPGRANVPSSSVTTSDSATQAVLMNQLPSFFGAYASGDPVTLGRFLAPGAVISGLGGQVAYSSLSSLTVPPGGTTRQIAATVVWRVPGQPGAGRGGQAGLEMTYALTVEKINGTWYVRDISPSDRPAGPP